MIYDAIIVGGGAAGLFCAAVAGQRGKRVLVLEHNLEVGRKILISGGGRCNFTNLYTSPENFISQNPHFCKSALARYTPADFVRLVKKHKIGYYEKKLGQLFCTKSSRQIVDMLLHECRQGRAEIRTNTKVLEFSREQHFVVETANGRFESSSLVVACGGLSFPKIGASDLGYRIARNFGLKIVPPRPALVALVMSDSAYPKLAGISADSLVSSVETSFRENILFTHRGMSGPAILQASNYWKAGGTLTIDLLPEFDVGEALRSRSNAKRRLGKFLADLLPERLVTVLLADLPLESQITQLSRSDIETAAARINQWMVRFKDTEGYDRAEVTAGGVSTDELSSSTLGSRTVPGLYFIGEVVDVTGWLGGFNFQWAWASGHAAAQAI